ncbi:MAG: GNAT family N-acetyltransferase [Chloroflexi bacterium]|nr:GNAT family N-acetyltransferase [Chloroflexota bacterium]
MTDVTDAAPEITYQTIPKGWTRVDAIVGGRSVSHCSIIPLMLQFGAARVRVDGIGGVWTEEDARQRGYARRVLVAAVQRMRAGDAALSLLYGIRDFYPRFGYATIGADYALRLTELDRPSSMPAGWTVCPFAPPDLPALQALYARYTARALGAAVRLLAGETWRLLAAVADPNRPRHHPSPASNDPGVQDECRVIEDPERRVAAYVWRANGSWAVQAVERRFPEALVLGEVVADGIAAADAAMAVCRDWAREESARRGQAVGWVNIGTPPEGAVAAAARHQFAQSIEFTWACGGPMVRVLDIRRLVAALQPELEVRWRAAGSPRAATVSLRTDLGDVSLGLGPDGVAVHASAPPPGSPPMGDVTPATVVRLPQTALARLACGGFPPDDLLARLEVPPDAAASQLLAALFPQRHPFVYYADRI